MTAILAAADIAPIATAVETLLLVGVTIGLAFTAYKFFKKATGRV